MRILVTIALRGSSSSALVFHLTSARVERATCERVWQKAVTIMR